MTREELLAEVTAERFGPPIRTDRRHHVPGDLRAIVAEIQATPTPIRALLDVPCDYAACDRTAARWLDGYALCADHLRKHRSEVVA